MIDTHAHLYLKEFKPDIAQVIQRSKDAGIQQVWLPGIDADSLPEMEALSNLYPGYFRLFAGLHPCDVHPDFQDIIHKIEDALKTGKYSGIGEIGLDLYWDKTYIEEQKAALTMQLDLAVTYNCPVILHIRDAFDEIMPIIRTYYAKGLKGIFHSFAGAPEQALELTQQGGFLLGVNGSITFKKSRFAEFLNTIPLEYIVTETDSPYLSPVPFRGKRNESKNISLIVKFIAKLYNISEQEVQSQTQQNATLLLS